MSKIDQRPDSNAYYSYIASAGHEIPQLDHHCFSTPNGEISGPQTFNLSIAEEVIRYLAKRKEQSLDSLTQLDVSRVVEKFKGCFDHIQKYVLGYEEASLRAKLALFTGNHLLLVGGSGIGKSYFGRGILNIFDEGVNTDKMQLTLETTEDSVFGYCPVESITSGTGARNLRGSFVVSDVYLLDEMFRARDDLLGSLLWPLSDRLFRNGNACVPCALHTVIGCTNFVRRNTRTEAFLGRFLFQMEISPSLDPIDRQAILRSNNNQREIPPPPRELLITLPELNFISYLIDEQVSGCQIRLPPDISMVLDAVVTEYEKKLNIFLGQDAESRDLMQESFRNLRQLSRVVKAHAIHEGRDIVTLDDLRALALTIPTVGHGEVVDIFSGAFREIMSFANSSEMNVYRTLSQINDLVGQVDQGIPIRPLSYSEYILKFLGFYDDRKITFERLTSEVKNLNLGRNMENLIKRL